MAQQLKNLQEVHDKEIMAAKEISIASTVKDTAKKLQKTSQRKRKTQNEEIDNDLPINKY